MFAVLVTIKMKSEYRDAYVKALTYNARSSVEHEPGCLRFDILQDEREPNTIHIYELYRQRGDFEAHRQTPHFRRFRDATEDRKNWITEPVVIEFCVTVWPPDDQLG